ncbi:MAG: protein kinase [Myxococcota bacterium]
MSRRQFKILKEIAEGGFGKVYLAELISADQQFSRIVAFKLLHEKWSTHDEVLSRTRDEARLLGLLRNDHIVKVEDLTSINGQCAIVMEYLEGVDLKWLIQFLAQKEQQCPYEALFEIIQAAADALGSAYNGVPLQSEEPLRVIHRDIKPSNILVTTSGVVKVLDFGTARANFAKREAVTEELAFGSQGYMSPERMLGEDDTPAADIFSLGITMYELLALDNFGKIPPRPAKFNTRVDEKIAGLKLTGPRQFQSDVRHILKSMLSYYPVDRPTAEQVIEVMEHLVSEADDEPLKRFARTVVGEARQAMPEVQSRDPLTGSIVQEDISESRPMASSGSLADTEPDREPLPVTVERPFTGRVPPPPSLPGGTLSPPSGVASQPFTRSTSSTSPPITTESSRLFLALSVFGGLGVGIVLLTVIGVAVYVIVTVGQPASSALNVDKPGNTKTVVKTTLQVTPPEAIEAKLQGDAGFKGTYQGPDSVTADLPAGTYQTVVKRGGDRIRGRTFELTGTECTVTLDLSAERWEAQCN